MTSRARRHSCAEETYNEKSAYETSSGERTYEDYEEDFPSRNGHSSFLLFADDVDDAACYNMTHSLEGDDQAAREAKDS